MWFSMPIQFARQIGRWPTLHPAISDLAGFGRERVDGAVGKILDEQPGSGRADRNYAFLALQLS
jgi:hypothetical protein